MVEVHNHPELALSDGAQALTPSEYVQLVGEVRAIRDVTTPIVSHSRIETKVA
jgi:3-deoxy-D-arabino-heptulosonate 7-phosphate (DAHP) synthase